MRRAIGARAVIRGQQDLRRARVLQLDKIRLVLDHERRAEPAGQRRLAGRHLDADLADRRMGQEIAAEQRVVLGLDGAALPRALDPLGAAAARPVQRQPMAAGLQPALASRGTARHRGRGRRHR